MRNATASGHPADIARFDSLIRAQAVLVLQLTLEQVGQCRQADMRMLGDIHAAADGVVLLEHVIEKHEGTDAAKACRGQWAQWAQNGLA